MLGNLYKVEALFLTGLHPWARVADVDDRLEPLVTRARTLMLANRDRPEQSTTGDLRKGFDHWVYGRKGKPCRRCRTPILMGDQGPHLQERVTYDNLQKPLQPFSPMFDHII